MRPNFASNRGSALLIVLGLLAFLMISAVAFSISMRTERSAAAAYRRNLMARELLSTAFADARATLDYALEVQRDDAGFKRNEASTRTVEALAPFKYPDEDRYGRLITSRNSDAFDATSVGNDSIAYLLDGKVLAHVPPYVAYPVYKALEQQQPVVNDDIDEDDHLGDGKRYYLDWSAGWKPIKAKIPKLTVDIKTEGNTIQEAVVGRMAWAVVNLSDSLDINAVGSASTCRGLGLTASEFAFGITDPAKVSESYALFKENKNTVDDTAVGLHIFCSNADLAQYTARVDVADDLVIESDGISPFSWQDAIANEEDGFYSPFSVYSFWPKSERTKENGTGSTSSESEEGTTLSCNDIDETSIASVSSGVGKELAFAVEAALDTQSDAKFNFISLLHDYLDKDTNPKYLLAEGAPDLSANAMPTVERVPMLTEVAYNAGDDWKQDGNISSGVKKSFEEAFKGIKPLELTSKEDIPETLGDEKIKVELPEFSQLIGLRSYFPGGKAATGNFTFEPEGFVGIIATAVKGGKEISVEKGAVTAELQASDQLDVKGGEDSLFQSTGVKPTVQLTANALTIEFNGKDVPVANPEKTDAEKPEAIEVDLLVDFFFRVPCKQGADVVDLCPAVSGVGTVRTSSDYAKSLNERADAEKMSKLDAQYFRITRPVKVTFTLQWKVTEETRDKQTVYKASIDEQALEVEASINMSEPQKMGSTEFAKAGDDKASYLSLSPGEGTWFAIDPRYNWLSPMLGVSDTPSTYVGSMGGSYRKNFSSPHWIFLSSGELTGGDNEPSQVQRSYKDEHADFVPFSWGLSVEDIRYGYSDAGQLFLPAELAFLPVPCDSDTWSPNKTDYLANSFSDYHKSVAKMSFFRTLPVVDLKDGAMDYTKYTKVASLLRGFGGENFPEEHRGIVNAFAAQDNYLLHQRLKQFALLGIPPTIKQAAYVTYQRLKATESVKRIASGMVNEDLKTLKDLTPDAPLTSEDAKPKYDEFVTKYLFPLPDTSGGKLDRAKSWTSEKQVIYVDKQGMPTRPKTLDFIVQDDPNGSFAERLEAYNATKGSSDKLGQNDMTTLLAIAKESFGDRQQLFLFILRADFIAYNSARELSAHKPLSTARAVALVWRDAYGELPDRVVYYQFIP